MNFVQKKRKGDAARKDIVDLQLMRGSLMQPPVRATTTSENRSNFSCDRSMSSVATIATTAYNNSNSSAYVGITCGRGHAQSEVGIAWIDIESPSIKLIQMSDDPWYAGLLNKLNIIQPAQVIVPQTIFDAKPETADGKLIKYLREQFPSFAVIKIPRRNFSDTDGTELINKYCSKKFSHTIQSIASKYYALSAVAGLMKFLLHSIHVNFRENSLKLEFDTKYGHLLMDVETTYTLELLNGSSRNRMKSIHLSLYDILDHCVTSIGKRTLRAKILEPSCDVPYIRMHQQCIAELNSRKYIDLKSLLAGILKQFNYVERLHKLALVVPQDDNIRAAEVLINQTIQLRTCLQLVPVLRAKLESLQSPMMQDIFNALSDERYQMMLDTIDTVLNKELIALRTDSTTQLTQRIHCIQPGKCKVVDMLRTIYTELISELQNYVTNLSARCGQAFKMHYDVTHGYHVRLMVAADISEKDLPPEFNVLSLKRNLCTLTTSEINKLNIRLKCVTEEITMQSNVVLAFMLTEIVTEIDAIYDLSGIVATLDNLISLATISARDDYVCPVFTNEIRIVDGVHPLLEGNVRNTMAVPNNIIGTPDYNFYIITGPNMSGKTVYLKMIAILQIMAQLGCYIPAKNAELRVTDRIFTRIGSNDSIEKNSSSFVLEVNMTEHILKNVTANSLVIIDELYRSTNPREGLQLAWSFCEHLLSKRGKAMSGEFFEDSCTADDDGKSIRTHSSSVTTYSKIAEITAPFVYLTTHYHNLTKLADWYFNVVNLSFNADEVPDRDGQAHLTYNHRIQEGVTAVESYGLKLAESVRFPPSIVPKAKLIYSDLKAREELDDTIIRRNGQRKCSELAKSLAALQINELNTAQSVVSAVMAAKSSKHIRNKHSTSCSRPRSAKTRFSTTTSNQNDNHVADVVDDSIFQIDKVLYNLYSDIASALRKCEMSTAPERPRSVLHSDTSYCSNISDTSNGSVSKNLEERQNEAILDCLKEFMGEQTNIFTEAVIDGLRDRAIDLITLPSETHLSQIIPNDGRLIDNMDPCTLRNSQSAKQQRPIISEFAVPSSVGNPESQLSVLSSSPKSFSQMFNGTMMSGVYDTPRNSTFEFVASPMPATSQLDNIWSASFGEALPQPITQNSHFRDDRFDFISSLSGACPSFRSSNMASNITDIPSGRSRSLFNISTQINPHLEFDTVRANRNGAGGSDAGTHSNNSENKYAKPFNSIQTDTKLCKSNPCRADVLNTMPITPTTSATIERTKTSHSAAAAAASPPRREPESGVQRSTTSNDVNCPTPSKKQSEKRSKRNKFQSQLTEFYQSEKFQRLHRIANSVCDASAAKASAVPKPIERTISTSTFAKNLNNETSSIVANASDATSGAPKDNDDATVSPLSETCLLPPPPGF